MSHHKHVRLDGTVTVGPKGQVVIPSEVRESMEIAPGDKLVALYLDDKNSVAFITERQTQEILLKWGSGTRRSAQSSKNLRKGIGGDIITVNAFTIVGNPQKIPYIQTLKSSPAAT